jgi:hypothetical protein
MVSRKWLYSYRMLTARLHDGVPTTNRTEDLAIESDTPQPRQIPVNDDLAVGEPEKTPLRLTAGKNI